MSAAAVKLPSVSGYSLAFATPLAVFFLLFFLAPLLLLILISFYNDTALSSMGAAQYIKFGTDGFSLQVLGDTLGLGVQVTLLCLLLGYALAWSYVRSPSSMQKVLMLIIVMPLLTSVVVRTFAWVVILGRQGIVNSMFLDLGWIETPLKLLYTRGGLIVALANVQLPLMVLPLITALQKLDPNLEDASSALGASAWRTFARITLPLTLPGIIAGCLLTFTASVTAFISQSLIGGGQMLFMPMYIYQQASTLQNWPFAAAISLVFLVAVLGCVTIFNLLGRMSRGSLAS
ncbi:ABC transporter permease [Rhodoferax sp.]|uniref:ABC transporter permease n=1 Tax=Rhodoferax sp. TaxID=50421 RepID=UPI0025E52999|nr:ABC transporter permease [Rhodoferax sp.]MCM2339884.1 ABC transporter permease [Rhodoferax sp.]